MALRLLLIEDNKELCEALKISLEAAGYELVCAHDGADGLYYLKQNAFDACILDRMLPELDGVTLLKEARGCGITTPVLMLTALSAVSSRIEGLDAGADDYLTKPFSTEELLARIRAILRRPAPAEAFDKEKHGDIELDAHAEILYGKNGECTLSKRETALLLLLLQNEGQTLSRQTLLLRVWGPDTDVEDGNLDNYIHLVRRRLQSVGSECKILTVRGVGYRFTSC